MQHYKYFGHSLSSYTNHDSKSDRDNLTGARIGPVLRISSTWFNVNPKYVTGGLYMNHTYVYGWIGSYNT